MLTKLINLFRPGGAIGVSPKRGAASKASGSAKEILKQHEQLHDEIQRNFRSRKNDRGALMQVMEACREQIALAPRAAAAFRREHRGEPLPFHAGFRQLAIILEERGDLEGALKLIREAQEQGWADNYESRIERLEGKLRQMAPA
jgi:hypothetical protein